MGSLAMARITLTAKVRDYDNVKEQPMAKAKHALACALRFSGESPESLTGQTFR